MKKHRMTTKALSMLLTVIMLFTTISVGLIVPESDIIASAAEGETFTVTSADTVVSEITAAINYANANPTLVTRIELTTSITKTGEMSAFPAISGNVVFDFKGYPLTFKYTLSAGYDSSETGVQIPKENVTDRNFLSNALFSVAAEGSLQFIDSGSLGAAALQLITDLEDTENSGEMTHITSSNLILNKGTLILGDKNDSSMNTFTLFSHSSARCTGSGTGGQKAVTVDSYAVTVNGTDAVFKMYGGTIRATGIARIKVRDIGSSNNKINLNIYGLNIESCYAAEIYGGIIEIPLTTMIDNISTGVYNSRAGNASTDGMNVSAIRCNTPNLYIFDVDLDVNAYAGSDSGDSDEVHLYLSDIYSTSVSNAAHVYGGSFAYSASTTTGNAPAYIDAYIARGAYKLAASGNLEYYADGMSDYAYDQIVKESGSNVLTLWTVFATNDGSARNGIDMFSYDTFGEFLSAYSSTSDGYYGNSGITNGTTAVPETGKYLRNGYTHTGWAGKTTPGGAYSTETNSPSLSGVSSNGGSLFLAPTWTPTLYDITYNLAASELYPVTNANLYADGSTYRTYRIDTTDDIPSPERPGWRFSGWKVDATVREATDSNFSWDESATYGGWNSATNTAINLSVTGHYGDITLTATWTPVTYTIGIDKNADGVVDTQTGDVISSYSNGAINSSQTIPNWLEKEHYFFDGYYVVSEADIITNWNIGDKITVATLNSDGSASEKYTLAMISAQFAGKYGSITRLTPHFTPEEYTITFDIDDDENRVDRPSSDDGDYIYTVETVRSLPILTPPGQRFNGWRVVSSEGNWVVGEVYKSIPAGMYGNVSFIADYSDKEYEIEIVLEEDEIFDVSPLGYGYTFKEGGTIDGIAAKNGWEFDGWEVVSCWSSFEDDEPDWVTGEIYYYDKDTGLTYFDSGKVGNVSVKPHFVKCEYDITFNANGGTAASSVKYKIDETAVLPSTSRSGWTFGGWKVSNTSGSWIVNTVYPAGSLDLTGLWGNVTLDAVWTETPYTVTLDLAGGEGVTNTVLSYITTASTALKETPVRTGYTFKGWEIYVYAGSWGDYKTKLESTDSLVTDAVPAGYYGNITLRAVWEATVYNIQFVRFSESNRTYTYEDTIVLPTASAPGQSFVGWQLSENTGNWISSIYNAGASFSNKYGNVTFTPLFNAKTYTINFVDSDGVTAIGSPLNYRFTDSFTLGTNSKPGYTFVGWQVHSIESTADCGGWTIGDEFPAGDMDAGRFYGNVTLKAVYEIIEYNITFIADGGDPIADMAYTTESTDVLPKPVKTGYDFGGWKVTAADGSWALNSTVVDGTALKGMYGDVTLTALWSAHYYTISWVVDGETVTTSVAYGDTPSYNGTPVKAQDQQYTYEFIGWSPAIDVVTGDATYTAQFKSELRIYTVTWKYLTSDADGTQETVVAETYKYGEKPVFAGGTPNKESVDTSKFYRFEGWYDEDDNRLTDSMTVTDNVVYTASFTEVAEDDAIKIIWKVEADTYETYWVAGDTPSYPGTTKLADKDGFSREIASWGVEIETIPEDATPDTYTKTYTAVIKSSPKSYQASFDLNGGKYDGQTVVTYNNSAAKPLEMPQPEKAGYTFMGWKVTKTENEDKWAYGSIYAEASYVGSWGDVSFVAVWKATEYTLTVRTDSGVTESVYTIESNSVIAPLAKEGYELTGWLVLTADADSNWKMGDTVPTDKSLLGMYGNVTVEPVWVAKTYNLNWVSGDVTQTVSVRYGEYIVSYSPVSKAGYTAKWQEEIPVTMPAYDVTINAVYTPIQYFLRFNSNGGSTVESFYYDITSDKTLSIPTREGATFKGWKVSAGGGSWIKDAVYDGGTALLGTYGNATLTAVWELEIFTITWIAGDTTRTTKWYHGAQPSYDGTPYKSPDFNNSYEFTGNWKTADGSIITDIPVVTGDATYEAVFRAVERIYTVKWDVDGKLYEQTYTYGQAVECPFSASNPPVRPSTNEYDFTFLGWSPEITLVTGDVTYTAIFDVYTKIQGLRIDHTAIFLDINDSTTVSAIISPSTATSKDVEWVSLNQNIATVNENGKIVGVSAGETLVRVQSKDGKFKAFCLVSVAPVTTDYIVVSAAGISTTRLPGEAVQLYATIMPENASNKIVKWTTSNPAVATVDANGLVVFGSTTGVAVITATSDGYASGSITVTCTTDDSAVNDNVKTYVVMFNKSSSTYIIAGQTYESINIICKEGDTIEFLLTEPHFVTLNATQFERDTDGYYRIKDIKENYTVIASERPDLGFESDSEETEDNGTQKLSFFDKLKEFFRSIVEFFRGLFGG